MRLLLPLLAFGKPGLATLLLIMICGCYGDHATPANAYKKSVDGALVALGLDYISGEWFGYWVCAREVSTKGTPVIENIPDGECYKFLPAQKMQGVFVDAFEESTFLPDATVPPSNWDQGKQRYWLSADANILPRKGGIDNPKFFHLEFIGRRAAVSGAYGHMGGSTDLIVVDRMLAVKEVSEQSPRP